MILSTNPLTHSATPEKHPKAQKVQHLVLKRLEHEALSRKLSFLSSSQPPQHTPRITDVMKRPMPTMTTTTMMIAAYLPALGAFFLIFPSFPVEAGFGTGADVVAARLVVGVGVRTSITLCDFSSTKLFGESGTSNDRACKRLFDSSLLSIPRSGTISQTLVSAIPITDQGASINSAPDFLFIFQRSLQLPSSHAANLARGR